MFQKKENRAWVRLVSFIIAAAMVLSNAADVFALRQAATETKARQSTKKLPIETIDIGAEDIGLTFAQVLTNKGIDASKVSVEFNGKIVQDLNSKIESAGLLEYLTVMPGGSQLAGRYVADFGEITAKSIVGGKGESLSRMTNLGISVPPGFTIFTDACKEYYQKNKQLPPGLLEQVLERLVVLEAKTGKKLGDSEDPLLVSVRSGAPFSMPGMMDTILNLGLNDQAVVGIAKQTNNERFALDTYRRFISMFGKTVQEIDGNKFEDLLREAKDSKGYKQDTELTADDLKELVSKYQQVVLQETGNEFPQDPKKQLDLAIKAVFNSWNTKRARDYRRLYKIPDDLGTAVNVQAMVFGNKGASSATGVAFSRDPATGERVPYGDFLINAQGEDVVAGIRNTQPIAELAQAMPEAHAQLMKTLEILERDYDDMVDTEFTIEEGKFYMLQARVGKRTIEAALKTAVDMVNEGLITEKEAVLRVDPSQLDKVLHPVIDPAEAIKAEEEGKLIAKGLNASPGAAVGQVVFSADDAETWAKGKKDVILTRWETNPDDLHGMVAAQGILTSHGGKTSHAAVVARGMGKPAVCGAEALNIDKDAKQLRVGNIVLKEGDWATIDGTTGKVFLGQLQTVEPKEGEVIQNFKTVMEWAKKYKRLGVRANADNPKDAAKAREFGAEGIGLARTEHMFLGDRLKLVQEIILGLENKGDESAIKEAERLLEEKLLPLQKNDFIGIYQAMAGYPVTIRLLDPPMHEFFANYAELEKEITDKKIELSGLQATFDERGRLAPQLAEKGLIGIQDRMQKLSQEIAEREELKERVDKMREANPMLGLRGVRLGIVHPELYKMQVRAIIEAALELKAKGIEVKPEIMIPLVAVAKELVISQKDVDAATQAVMREKGQTIEYTPYTMIELPGAAVAADEIGKLVGGFSFGTNDLTQTTFGFSRDDVEAKFMALYLALGIFKVSPFETIHPAVAEMVRMAVEKGRMANPDLKFGVCGEHGGDPDSVHVFHEIGLDYVSASPYRISSAILAAAQAAILEEQEKAKEPSVAAMPIEETVNKLQSSIIAETLNALNEYSKLQQIKDPAEVADFLNAGSVLHSAEGGAALYDYVADVREKLSQYTQKEKVVKGRALIVGPEFFRQGGVIEALRTAAELDKAVKVAIYGEDAEKLKILAANKNIITAPSFVDILTTLQEDYHIASKDMVLLDSREAAGTIIDVYFSNLRQVIAPEGIPATVALAKALRELFSDMITHEAFQTLLDRMADAEIIDRQTLNESRDELLVMLQEGRAFTFKTELVTERMSKDVAIADARRKVKKFMGKYI